MSLLHQEKEKARASPVRGYKIGLMSCLSRSCWSLVYLILATPCTKDFGDAFPKKVRNTYEDRRKKYSFKSLSGQVSDFEAIEIKSLDH